MRRRINFENLIVVGALAIAVSLLMSACGPGSTKTVKVRDGKRVFADKGSVGKTDQDQKPQDQAQTQQEKNVQAVQEKRKTDIAIGRTEVANVAVTTEFSNRIQYIVYKELKVKDDKGEERPAFTLSASIKSRDKVFLVKFMDPKPLTEDQTLVELQDNQAREIIDGQLSGGLAVLNISAQVKRTSNGRVVVTLIETSYDDKKKATVAEVNALISLNNAIATVNSKDENLLLMKDAIVTTRATQLYISDDSVLEEKKIKNLDSEANRIVIEVKSKDGKDLFSLLSQLTKDLTTRLVLNSGGEATKEAFKENFSEMHLTSNTDVIKSDLINLIFTKSSDKTNDTVTLNLAATASEKESNHADDAVTSTDSKLSAEKISDDKIVAKNTATPAAGAGASAKTDTTDSDAVVPARVFDDSQVPLTMPDAPAAATTVVSTAKKSDFSQVTASVTTTAIKLPAIVHAAPASKTSSTTSSSGLLISPRVIVKRTPL
jgi:hypothetical protein